MYQLRRPGGRHARRPRPVAPLRRGRRHRARHRLRAAGSGGAGPQGPVGLPLGAHLQQALAGRLRRRGAAARPGRAPLAWLGGHRGMVAGGGRQAARADERGGGRLQPRLHRPGLDRAGAGRPAAELRRPGDRGRSRRRRPVRGLPRHGVGRTRQAAGHAVPAVRQAHVHRGERGEPPRRAAAWTGSTTRWTWTTWPSPSGSRRPWPVPSAPCASSAAGHAGAARRSGIPSSCTSSASPVPRQLDTARP